MFRKPVGINIVTRADSDCPDILKSKLKNTCPPLFYYSGSLELNKNKYIGFVGSRTVNEEDTKFAENMVSRIVSNGYGVVSGGAKGIDTISSTAALEAGAECIEYVSDSLAKKIKKREVLENIRNKKLILLSIAKPDAGFNAGLAMQRNKYIYIQSQGTIVVKSDYNKGGTWSGATEALRKDYCKVLCRENRRYPGNTGLIKLGAIPVNESWDGNIDEITPVINDCGEQLSLFG